MRQHGGDKGVARTLELSTRPRPRPVPPVHRGHLSEALKRRLVASIDVRNTRTSRIGPGGCWVKSGVLAPGTRAGAEGCGACHVPSVKWGSSGFGAAMPGCAWEGNVSLARMYAVAASCPPTPDPAIAGCRGCCKARAPSCVATKECTIELAHHPVPRHGAAREGAAWWRADRPPVHCPAEWERAGLPVSVCPKEGIPLVLLVGRRQ